MPDAPNAEMGALTGRNARPDRTTCCCNNSNTTATFRQRRTAAAATTQQAQHELDGITTEAAQKKTSTSPSQHQHTENNGGRTPWKCTRNRSSQITSDHALRSRNSDCRHFNLEFQQMPLNRTESDRSKRKIKRYINRRANHSNLSMAGPAQGGLTWLRLSTSDPR